ncbi:MAG: MBL fold metallo-hydrolase [Ignisphaera sp.]
MTKIVFLGVGGWISDPLLGYTSFVIVNSSGNWILVEAGEGVYGAMRKCGLQIDDNFKGVVISHRHGDHVLGLPTLLQIANHLGYRKMLIVSIDDVIEAIVELLKASSSLNLLHLVDFIKIGFDKRVRVGDFEIEFLEAIHTTPAASIKIIVDGKCIVYSGDTSYNPKLIEFARGCDILIHEASTYSEEAHRYGHSTYKDAINIAIKSNVKKLILIHFYLWPQPIKTPINEDLEILVPYPCQQINV